MFLRWTHTETCDTVVEFPRSPLLPVFIPSFSFLFPTYVFYFCIFVVSLLWLNPNWKPCMATRVLSSRRKCPRGVHALFWELWWEHKLGGIFSFVYHTTDDLVIRKQKNLYTQNYNLRHGGQEARSWEITGVETGMCSMGSRDAKCIMKLLWLKLMETRKRPV